MNRLFFFFAIIAATMAQVKVPAQTNITIDAGKTYQTIRGIGASDAWNADYVGKYWDDSVKNVAAEKLFSQSFDSLGNPTGIGLSRWRFNIGAGSAAQGDESNIELEERRVECFLDEDGNYNWEQQQGQQWFLAQAHALGVESLVAFVNSPPYFFTKSGRANSDNTEYYGSTNLNDTCYDDFAGFLATVLEHFEEEGLPFSQISPVNEPQYAWNEGQEGCPWTNAEITKLVNELSSAITDKGLSTKILLSEAGKYPYLYQSSDKFNQILAFFDPSYDTYIGDDLQVERGLGAHSYYTDYSDSQIKSAREQVYDKSLEVDSFEVYQTEYNLLSKNYDSYLENAIFLAKMIYADLAIANASVWDYWTAMERERWSQLNRFYLIRLIPEGGDYASLTNGGTLEVNKNLWALGNYSLFIRPGYKRIGLTGANDLSGLMGSAYISPDSSQIVTVYVNFDTNSVVIEQAFENLPVGTDIESTIPYLTNSNLNLQKQDPVETGTTYNIPPLSVTTMVSELSISQTSTLDDAAQVYLKVLPNPVKDQLQIVSDVNIQSITVIDTQGRKAFYLTHMNTTHHTLNVSSLQNGVYTLMFRTQRGVSSQKFIKQ